MEGIKTVRVYIEAPIFDWRICPQKAIGSTFLSALITRKVPVVFISTRTWLLGRIRVLLSISRIGVND